jgi:predicted ArsR family transcriptional regulator
MLAILGNRRRELLKLLLGNKAGLTVDELSRRLSITRNAVRQHVTAMENDGLVAPGSTRPSGGRPEQLYVLTEAGREFFPRQYSWFAQLIVDSIKAESGAEGLRRRLSALGAAVARRLRAQHPGLGSRREKIAKLAELMEQMGYNASPAAAGASSIEADNCVFHELARKNPEVCQFDLALLSTFTDSNVEHQECMAKGGNVCRFKFTPKK